MNITLIGSNIDELSLCKSDEKVDNMEFHVSTAFSSETDKSFLIIFSLKLKVGKNNNDFLLNLRHLSKFETSEKINKDNQNSKFFSINAPAIAYPFLRAYVANFLLSSGFDPIIMPTINFVNLVCRWARPHPTNCSFK